MKNKLTHNIALAIALGYAPEHPLLQRKSPLPPKDKTLGDISRMHKAAEKRLRKANKRIELANDP